MKITLDLPEDLIREVKLRAVLQRRTVKDLVADFIRQGLGMTAAPNRVTPPVDSRVQIDDLGLPTIRCTSGGPAEEMSVEQLLVLERQAQEEEDLQRAGLPL